MHSTYIDINYDRALFIYKIYLAQIILFTSLLELDRTYNFGFQETHTETMMTFRPIETDSHKNMSCIESQQISTMTNDEYLRNKNSNDLQD